MKLRGFHRVLGLALFVLIVNSAVTGLLRANARWWYWKDRPARASAASLTSPAFDIERVFALFPDTAIARIELNSLAGKPVYLVESQQKPSWLVDAVSGKILSPVSLELAIAIAEASVPEGTPMAMAEHLPAYRAPKSHSHEVNRREQIPAL